MKIFVQQTTNKLQVQVNNSVNTPPLKTTGEYDFSINENILIISDDPSADGFRATLTKRTQ